MSATLDRICAALGERVLDSHEHRGDITVLVPADAIHSVLQRLRDDPELGFNVLVDVTAVDYLGRDPRFEVVYHLASIELDPPAGQFCSVRGRVRVKAAVAEESASLPSVSDLWSSADWMEREVWDLYGIRFAGHPYLRRILLYEEFQGHPLRKDYPKERRQPLVGPRN